MKFLQKNIIKPEPEWFQKKSDDPLDFPVLYHIIVNQLDTSIIRSHEKDLIIGATWTHTESPFMHARRQIFERLHLPYKINSSYIQVRNGVLLWPVVNLSAYTLLQDERRVFLYHEKKKRFIAEFKFNEYYIELLEEFSSM